MEVTYNGKTYQANDKKELMRILRENRVGSYRKIGQLLECSGSYVAHILNNEFNMYGELDFPELRNPGTFENKTDEQIARDLNIPIFRVVTARKELNLTKHNIVKLHRRRRRLAKFLFGCNPGYKFEIWLEKIIKNLNTRQEEIMREFYIEGATESTHENINSDSARVYRSLTRKELKESLSSLDIEELINKGVLKNGSTA